MVDDSEDNDDSNDGGLNLVNEDQSGADWNVVPSPDLQSEIVNNYANSIAAMNINQPPSEPTNNSTGNAINNFIFGKGKTFSDALNADSTNNSLAKTNQNIVTHAIANQGQLLPIPGAQSSSSSETNQDLKKLLAAIQSSSATSSGGSSSSGSNSSGGIGNDVAQGVSSAIGNVVSGGSNVGNILGDVATAAAAVVGWIICTELMLQGKMPRKWWIVGSKVFANYPEIGKLGYYLWAIPSVKHLRKHPNSFYSLLLCKIFLWRAENIAHANGVRGARKLWRGAFVTMVLFPVCYALGIVLAVLKIKLNYMQVYEVQK